MPAQFRRLNLKIGLSHIPVGHHACPREASLGNGRGFPYARIFQVTNFGRYMNRLTARGQRRLLWSNARDEKGSIAMKTDNSDVVIQRLDEWRYAVAVDGLVRYAGSQAECERRAAIFVPKNDRAAQDQALLRLAYLSR